MELKKEKNFPRGGRKPALFKSSSSSTFSFLRKPKAKLKKKNKKDDEKSKKKSKISEKLPEEKFSVRFVEDLKLSVIQDGMLVLGIVSKVTDRIATVSLPGGLRGAITLANTSEFYKNLIENSNENSEVPGLQEILKVGDILPVKVLAASETHHSLMVTCDPLKVNEKLSYNLIEEGLILVGSVKSEEDHGLIIDFGITQVQGFLKYENINENQILKVGQFVRCCVINCKLSPGSCSVQLSILKKDLQSACIKKNSRLPVSCFIPGFQFEVSVKKVLSEGVEVSYKENDSAKGFIHESYLLNKFSNPDDVEINSKVIATLLYVKPFVNFLYFKLMPKSELKWPFKYGAILAGKVMKVKRNGVIFKISEGSKTAKCFVPLSKLKNGLKSFEEKSDILNIYPVNTKVPKIRLGHVDWMARYYVGATDRASVEEKYYSISDLKCGDMVTCSISGFGKSAAHVRFGKGIKGIVDFTEMTDVPLKNPTAKFKVGQKIKARVVEILSEKLLVKLTMKPTLLKEKNILCDSKKWKKNTFYVGTIAKVMDKRIIVRFFNRVFGMVPKHLTHYPDSNSLTKNYDKGQLIKCSVIDVDSENRLLLSLFLTNAEAKLEVGKKYEVEVLNKTERGLFVEAVVDENLKCTGYLPSALLTAHWSLVSALHGTYSPGEKLWAYCIFNNIKNEAPVFGSEEVFRDFYEGKSPKQLQKLLTKDSVLPFLFRNKSQKTQNSFLKSIIPGTDDWSVIVRNSHPGEKILLKYQLVYGKILSVAEHKIEVSVKLFDVWEKDFQVSLSFLDSYLKSMKALVERQNEKLSAFNEEVCIGHQVKGVIDEVKENHAIVRTQSGDLGIAKGKFEKGQEVNGKIIWIDGPQQLLYISAKTSPPDKKSGRKRSSLRENDNVKGKVVLINEEVIVLELLGRGGGELAFFPRRRHLNDWEDTECVIGLGEILKLWITRKDSGYVLAMDRRIVSLQEKVVWEKSQKKLEDSVQNLKRKLEAEKLERLKKRKTESDEIQVVDVRLSVNPKQPEGEVMLPEVKEEKDIDDEPFTCATSGVPRLEYDDVEIKSEVDADEDDKETPNCNTENEEKIVLSSSSESEDEIEPPESTQESKTFKVDFDWEVLNNNSLLSGAVLNKEESSSDEEEDESKSEKKKRRRLTGIEKKEKAKSEEERLRSIEERLMDTEREPETADDFDRLVLSNPNSSTLWLKYMAFHIQGTEIEKARAVARRALKAISFREEQEKLNVWIALLNLENIYGSEESLSRTLSEALQVNDPYKIHLHLLTMHGQGSKFQEMEKLGNFMLKKYKEMDNMWCDVAAGYFAVGKVESARNVLQKALGAVRKSQHVPLISKFAQLENKYGSPERAQTLFESILASFPKRVDIWCSYVDMLVKSNHIDLARQVLERATSQSLRPRKMKTLFKKFIAFEESHGSPENVDKVRDAAVEYVETVGA